MATVTCPKCGELNNHGSMFCAVCGAKINEDNNEGASESANWSIFSWDHLKDLLGVLAGIGFILVGIFIPWLGSLIIQGVLCLTASNRRDTSLACNATPGNSDWWLVAMVGFMLISFCGYDLYKSWENRSG